MPHGRQNLPATEIKIQNQDDDLDSFENSQPGEEWHEDDDDSEWHRLTSDEGIDVNSPLTSDSQDSNEDWYTYNNNNVHFGRNSNAFDWSDDDNDDDDNDRRFELTQLTNRRIVSNLLQCDFGLRLYQLLMQSYVERKNQAFDNESENQAIDSVIPQTQIINGLKLDMDNLHSFRK